MSVCDEQYNANDRTTRDSESEAILGTLWRLSTQNMYCVTSPQCVPSFSSCNHKLQLDRR